MYMLISNRGTLCNIQEQRFTAQKSFALARPDGLPEHPYGVVVLGSCTSTARTEVSSALSSS